MNYPKLTFGSSNIEGIFLFGFLCLSNKIYGLNPQISLEVSKSCIWKKPKLVSIDRNVAFWFEDQMKMKISPKIKQPLSFLIA